MKDFIKHIGFFTLMGVAVSIFYLFDYKPTAFYGIFVGLIITSIFLEKWIPYNKEWLKYNKDLKQDITYGVFSVFVNPFAKTFAVYLFTKSS